MLKMREKIVAFIVKIYFYKNFVEKLTVIIQTSIK